MHSLFQEVAIDWSSFLSVRLVRNLNQILLLSVSMFSPNPYIFWAPNAEVVCSLYLFVKFRDGWQNKELSVLIVGENRFESLFSVITDHTHFDLFPFGKVKLEYIFTWLSQYPSVYLYILLETVHYLLLFYFFLHDVRAPLG